MMYSGFIQNSDKTIVSHFRLEMLLLRKNSTCKYKEYLLQLLITKGTDFKM